MGKRVILEPHVQIAELPTATGVDIDLPVTRTTEQTEANTPLYFRIVLIGAFAGSTSVTIRFGSSAAATSVTETMANTLYTINVQSGAAYSAVKTAIDAFEVDDAAVFRVDYAGEADEDTAIASGTTAAKNRKSALLNIDPTDFDNVTAFSQGFEVTEEIEQHDVTTSENKGNVAMIGGLSTYSATLNFLQDFDTGKLHDILFPIVSNRRSAVLIVRPDTRAAISDDNRAAVFQGVIATYNPMTAAINSVLDNPISVSPGPRTEGVGYHATLTAVRAVKQLAHYPEATAT